MFDRFEEDFRGLTLSAERQSPGDAVTGTRGRNGEALTPRWIVTYGGVSRAMDEVPYSDEEYVVRESIRSWLGEQLDAGRWIPIEA